MGVWQTLPAHQIPPNTLYDASNVYIKDGALRPRPGLKQQLSTILTSRPNGGTVHVSGSDPSTAVLGTVSDILVIDVGGNWSSIKGSTTLQAPVTNPSRFTSLRADKLTYIVMANGADTPIYWNGSGNAKIVPNSPPIFSDVTTSLDRIVGLVPPYKVQWGELLDLTTWASANFRDLADTPDRVVAIRNLGTLGLVVYKTRSIWIGQAQGGPSASAFSFSIRGFVDGPGGPSSVVDANGTHYYMTSSGRIGSFDGNTHQWVADGIWPLIRADINQAYANIIWGAYHPNENIVVFFYPRASDQGDLKGIVVLNLPYPSAGIQNYAAFPGTSALSLTGGMTVNEPDQPVVLITASDSSSDDYSYIFDPDTGQDNGVDFTGFFQHGIYASPQLELLHPHIEPFFARDSLAGSVEVQLVSSNNLSTAGGTLGEKQTLDLTQTPIVEYTSFSTQARFFGMRVNFTSSSNAKMRYFGSQVFSRRPH